MSTKEEILRQLRIHEVLTWRPNGPSHDAVVQLSNEGYIIKKNVSDQSGTKYKLFLTNKKES